MIYTIVVQTNQYVYYCIVRVGLHSSDGKRDFGAKHRCVMFTMFGKLPLNNGDPLNLTYDLG